MSEEEKRRKALERVKELRARVEEEERKRALAAKVFDIDEFIIDAEKTRETYVPEINRWVRWKKLLLGDEAEIRKIEDLEERGQERLYRLLSKVDPSITREKIKLMPSDAAYAILMRITAEPAFLLEEIPKPLRRGLTKTRRRKTRS